MSSSTRREPDADLREMWFEATDETAPGADCPSSDAIWNAVSGTAEPPEVEAVVDHVTGCPACAQAWRVAREMLADPRARPAAADGSRPARGKLGWRIPLTALAAAFALVIGLRWLSRPSPDSPRYRETPEPVLQSALVDDVLPRDDFTLRWTALEDGAIYTLRVTTEDLSPVAAADGLAESEYRVPTERLATIADGERVLWQVEAVLRDARTVESLTFFAEVAAAE